LERFVAVLIEHCAGKFPLWLAPDQVSVLPIGDKYVPYAEKIGELLKISEIRALVDVRNEKIGKKIREAELNKIPYMLVLGEKEMESGNVTVRKQGSGDLGSMSLDDFKELIRKECIIEELKLD
jgi:threonyl-tRNA synthetase